MVGLVHRLVELLPGVITSLETCGLAEEARLVTGMFQGGRQGKSEGGRIIAQKVTIDHESHVCWLKR